MSDNLRRYCAIQSALKQLLPAAPAGNQARHLNTLAALVSGIIGSRKTHLPAVAGKVPGGSSPKGGKRESRAKRFARFLRNPKVTPDAFFLPYARALVASLPPGPLVLVMDGSVVGRGCMALMLSALYECRTQRGSSRRALPLCWLVVRAPKGHFAQERHQELVAQAQALIPSGREVIFLGDGEFDGPGLLQDIAAAGWHYVCRTAKSVRLAEADWAEEPFSLSQLCLQPGDCVEMPDLLFRAQGLGPVLVGAVWERGQTEPLLLVTSLDFLDEARSWYRRRFGVETFFSDQKSRGFYLGHSHLSDPERLCRLLIATCLAYYWVVCLGAQVLRQDWQGVVHRHHRCDLSLFQLGLAWLDHCLNENQPVPVYLRVEAECVR
ncbi:MAG: transposase [Armatimonadetes bacterium]|nr:transposase [Armatimonadota bacterium]